MQCKNAFAVALTDAPVHYSFSVCSQSDLGVSNCVLSRAQHYSPRHQARECSNQPERSSQALRLWLRARHQRGLMSGQTVSKRTNESHMASPTFTHTHTHTHTTKQKIMQEMSKPSEGPLTDYVSTRWYRSPELLLGDEVSPTCG